MLRTHLFALALLASVQPLEWRAWLDARTAGFSGVVLVARGDSVDVAAAYGGHTPDTRFNVGSINKTFTAIAIAQLIQHGRLSLDDTLTKVLPEYPNAAAARITIRDLVSHRSGVATFMRADFGGVSLAEMVKAVAAAPMTFDPGTRQAYSNGGYVVLGRVIELVSGKSYASYLADHVYGPAGMARMPARPGIPAGGGYFSAEELLKFARALRTGRLLNPTMTEYVLHGTFTNETGPRVGFALREQMVGARRFIGNGGGAPGVNAEFRFEPAGEYTVVVLTDMNPPAASRMMAEILNRIAQPSLRMPSAPAS